MKRFFALLLGLLMIFSLSVPALAVTEEEREALLLEAGLAALDACVEEDMTDLEKLTALHDWMCLNVDYGATLRSQTAYGALVEGSAVCTGYAAGFAYLAELAGLEGVATYSQSMDHAWILVTLDGVRYFSDCTWDDGKNAKMGLIRHLYFLFDQENAGDTGHYGWDSGESVPGGELEEAPWLAAMTRVIFYGDYCYYIDADFQLWRCDRATWETELLLAMEERWPIWEEAGSYRTGLYSGLILLEDRLYFSTPYEICSVDLEGQDLTVELTADTAEGVIYGLDVREGTLTCSIATEPDAVLYQVVDSGISAVGAWGYAWPEETASGDPAAAASGDTEEG
ncbi:MAG: hypothetical protein LUG57_02945 [Oscillospiraceae bacterium]|nr:hypothetical protein [Oscillospiraceae bacterium]